MAKVVSVKFWIRLGAALVDCLIALGTSFFLNAKVAITLKAGNLPEFDHANLNSGVAG